ncbi:MAG TPA: hypothetical protein VIB48_24010 [Acidimicrobiia bacterium]|jgi:hypothetical protein
MRVLATAIFERVVYFSHCVDPTDPAHLVLEVDAVLRAGDADGPLLLPVADWKRMAGFDVVDAHLPRMRASGRTTTRDGVEYLTFPVWERTP